MKLLGFERKKIGKVFERLGKFWPKDNLFMSYLRRLFKELVFIFAFLFLSFLILNLLLPKSRFEKAKENILVNPFDYQSHLLLGQYFLKANDFDRASAETGKDYQDLRSEPEKIKQEIVFWQKVSEMYPGYRDAYLKLAILSQKIYRDFDAGKFLEKALAADPNNETAKKVSALLGK